MRADPSSISASFTGRQIEIVEGDVTLDKLRRFHLAITSKHTDLELCPCARDETPAYRSNF